MKTQLHESTQQLSGAAETLLFTLYARALETQRPEPLFRDETSLEILNRLNYDFSKWDGAWKTLVGTLARTLEIDRLVVQFLAQHPNPVVLNLGSGLCTRYFRLKLDQTDWYEIDVPEVIALRRKFLKESEHYHFLGSSVLEDAWMSQIRREPAQPLLILMEGLSMYLAEDENRSLVQRIQTRFAPCTMIFDVHSRNYAPQISKTDAVTKTSAVLKSGLDSAQEIEAWNAGLTAVSESSLSQKLALYPQRLPWQIRPFRHLLFRLQPQLSQVWRLIQLQVSVP
jgi:O-methyltransferase involved in polyketide biosynthesis